MGIKRPGGKGRGGGGGRVQTSDATKAEGKLLKDLKGLPDPKNIGHRGMKDKTAKPINQNVAKRKTAPPKANPKGIGEPKIQVSDAIKAEGKALKDLKGLPDPKNLGHRGMKDKTSKPISPNVKKGRTAPAKLYKLKGKAKPGKFFAKKNQKKKKTGKTKPAKFFSNKKKANKSLKKKLKRSRKSPKKPAKFFAKKKKSSKSSKKDSKKSKKKSSSRGKKK